MRKTYNTIQIIILFVSFFFFLFIFVIQLYFGLFSFLVILLQKKSNNIWLCAGLDSDFIIIVYYYFFSYIHTKILNSYYYKYNFLIFSKL